ncbi:hypothetical protein CDD83_2741 [Cordyceps sp. RAO-2017]|nr:hypothetical protein CDD83_2741 [Cordyceps sp. RAO-2017]
MHRPSLGAAVLLLLAAAAAPAAAELPCRIVRGYYFDGRSIHELEQRCAWWGEAIGCGETHAKLGDVDDVGRSLVGWTRDPLCYTRICGPAGWDGDVVGLPGSTCCDAYGAACWSGYKRLWCWPERVADHVFATPKLKAGLRMCKAAEAPPA